MPGKGKEKSNDEAGKYASRVSDPRFARLHSDPRFLRPNREDGKVILDDRFKGLLAGKRDANAAKVDKYGRKPTPTDRSQKDLARLYRVEDEEDDDSSSSSTKTADGGKAIDYARGEGMLESSGDESSEAEEDDSGSDEDGQDVLIGPSVARRKQLRAGPEEESESDDDIDTDDERLAELDARAERAVKQEMRDAKRRQKQASTPFAGDTARLAAVNMDWDHIRAIDLYKVFSSIVSPAARSAASIHAERRRQAANSEDWPIMPVHGRCLGVRIYPSEFGRKRMAAEMINGPPKEIFKGGDSIIVPETHSKKPGSRVTTDESDEDIDTDDEQIYDIDEGGDFDEEALRKYQLDRLRYFYAVATFDSPQTARYVFDQVDGSEMEHTANMFDLSFVPAEMTFPDWQAPNDDAADEGYRDEANERTINDASYQGVDFATDALRHSKVKLTWDADDPQRAKVTRQIAQKALTSTQLRDDDFKAYLASGSEASDIDQSDEDAGDADGKDGSRDRVRALLGLTEGKESNGFGKARSSAFADARKTAAQTNEGDMEITFLPGLSEAAERRKKGTTSVGEEDETALAKYKRKQKERRERRKKQGEVGADNDDEDDAEPITFDDEFFASDDEGEIDFDAALAAENSKKQTPFAREHRQKEGGKVDGANLKELDLLIGSDDELADSRAGHFSLKDILKAEQAADGKGKKGRWAKKKEKKQQAELSRKGENAIQSNFEINVQDPRFSNLFQDHRFALDPSHPSYIKTKSTQRLVEERRKRTEKEQRPSERDEEKKRKTSNEVDHLSDLVRSVKKRATNGKEGKARR